MIRRTPYLVPTLFLLRRLLPLLLIPGLVLLAIWSAWFHRTRWQELLPLYLFPIGLMAGYVLFTVEAGRYALPVLPCLMVLSVAALAQVLLSRMSVRHR